MKGGCVAIDWGSTNLRAFHIKNESVVSSISLPKGVKNIQSKQEYPELLKEIVKNSFDVNETIPILLSGMVGGQAGWVDTPYQRCPFIIDTFRDYLIYLPQDTIDNPVFHFPGLSYVNHSTNESGVMRGEEVQIIGMLEKGRYDLIILAGTHSKWVNLSYEESPRIDSFSTFMTGELYEILSKHSLLVKGTPEDTFSQEGFKAGIEESDKNAPVIASLFQTRSQMLTGLLNPEHARSFLSGLLISDEIKNNLEQLKTADRIAFLGPASVEELYKIVFSHNGIKNIDYLDAEETTISGYKKIIDDAF